MENEILVILNEYNSVFPKQSKYRTVKNLAAPRYL